MATNTRLHLCADNIHHFQAESGARSTPEDAKHSLGQLLPPESPQSWETVPKHIWQDVLFQSGLDGKEKAGASDRKVGSIYDPVRIPISAPVAPPLSSDLVLV